MTLIDLIPSEIIKSVPLTASFEAKLKLIKNGEYTKERFLKEIMDNVEEFIEDVKKSENGVGFSQVRDDEICKCPNCGSSIVKGKYGYNCSNWKNCKVNIYFNATQRLGGKDITKTQAKELLTQGQTKKEVTLHSKKTDKDYQAYLTYDFNIKDEYPNKIGIKFNNQ